MPRGAIVSPLATWLPDDAAVARFRRRWLGRTPVVLPPRDGAWRAIAPGFRESVAMLRGGLPFQTVLARRYDSTSDPRRLARALAAGATVYAPQIHQVLPRVARLMVALRAALLGPRREARSFLFLVHGRGRAGMGLHHDGPVDAFWLQLEGRRTVTLGPPVAPGSPPDLDSDRIARVPGAWRTLDLRPGTLFYLPPFTPHDVVCRSRSLALSLTWRVPRRARMLRRRTRRSAALTRRLARDFTEWDVVSGRVATLPRTSGRRLWTLVPLLAGGVDRRRGAFPLATPDGALWLPAAAHALARRLATMPSLERATGPSWLTALLEHGILGPRDLPLRIIPDDPAALDGWRFA